MQHNTKCSAGSDLSEHCSGCTDKNSEGTHQGCTIEHGHIGCDQATGSQKLTIPSTEKKWPDSVPTEKGCCDRCFSTMTDPQDLCTDDSCSCHHPTKESGEWEIWDKTIEEIKKFEFMQDFVTSDGTTFSPTGIIGSIEPVLMDGVREMLAHAEKQAREEDIEEAFEKSAWGKAKAEMLLEEGRQRGADEMVERIIAMVPEEHYGLLGVQIGRVYNAEDKAWNACREAILTSLRSLKSKE